MTQQELKEILETCEVYCTKPYLGSDGFHHRYGEKQINLSKLKEILSTKII